MTQQEYQNVNNLFASLQSNMFGAKLARYYMDNDENVEEIEAQLYLVETRFNRKRVQIIDNEDDLALQTFILI